jgi:hypothetical protein
MERYVFQPCEKKDIEAMFLKLPLLPFVFKPPRDDIKEECLYGLIPDGSRFYCCFLKYKNKQFCVFLNGRSKALVFGFRIQKLLLILKNPIIIFGTKFTFKKRQMFCCEHVLGEPEKRLMLLKVYLKAISYLGSADTIYFSCPIFLTNVETVKHMLTKRLIPYKTKFVEIHECGQKKISLIGYRKFIEKAKGRETRAFFVSPDIALPDTYYLFNKWDDHDYVDMMSIPDYKTSLYMNQLFGKKKSTLESLEESDDEEEQEKESVRKKIMVECYLLETTKRWTPII